MTIDPREFQATQREAWSSVAPGWSDWWHVFEDGAAELNERLVEAAGVAPGQRVLDVATGIGEPALTAAARVGPAGHVLGIDLAPAMVAHARERAARAGLAQRGQVEFREGDAEELDLAPASFDAALSRWGLMLMLRPERALAGIRRALRPGARLSASVWADPREVPFLATPGRVAREVLGLDAPAPDDPGPFRLAEEGALDALLAAAGFTDLVRDSAPVTMEFDSAEHYVAFVFELSSSMRKRLAEATEAQRDAVRSALVRAAADHADAAGRVRFANRAWVVSGRSA